MEQTLSQFSDRKCYFAQGRSAQAPRMASGSSCPDLSWRHGLVRTWTSDARERRIRDQLIDRSSSWEKTSSLVPLPPPRMLKPPYSNNESFLDNLWPRPSKPRPLTAIIKDFNCHSHTHSFVLPLPNLTVMLFMSSVTQCNVSLFIFCSYCAS